MNRFTILVNLKNNCDYPNGNVKNWWKRRRKYDIYWTSLSSFFWRQTSSCGFER